MTEGIRIDPNYIAPADANLNNDDPEGNSEVDNEAEDWRQEEAYKDGWMTNFRQVSSHESLSQAVRKVIRQVPKLDYRGKYERMIWVSQDTLMQTMSMLPSLTS